MKKYVLFMLMLCCPVQAKALESEVFHFETGKANIQADEVENLEVLADQIKKDKAVVVIVGHADKRGSRLYNFDLGNKRAEAVRNKLNELGVSNEQLIISVSYGKDKPAAPDDLEPGHLASNRRVEVVPIKSLMEQKVVIKEVPVVQTVTKDNNVIGYRKNRLTLFGGASPTSLDKTQIAPQHFVVDKQFYPAFGAGYARSLPWLNGRLSLGISAFTNNSYFGNVGYDF